MTYDPGCVDLTTEPEEHIMASPWASEIVAADAVTVDAAQIAHQVRHQRAGRVAAKRCQVLESAHTRLQGIRPPSSSS